MSNLLKKESRIGINMKKVERMIKLKRIEDRKNKIECLRKVEIIVIKNNNKIWEIVNIIQTNLCKTRTDLLVALQALHVTHAKCNIHHHVKDNKVNLNSLNNLKT